MANNYMNLSGLSHFWAKIKALVNTKADTSRVVALEQEVAALKEQFNTLQLGFVADESEMIPTDSISALNEELENLLDGAE